MINYPNSLRSSYYTHSNELVSEVHYSDFSFSQFTGKYDNNRTPIFENDFIKGEVLFNNDNAAFEVSFFDGEVSGFGALKGKSIVVTGNRFEIPEVQVK